MWCIVKPPRSCLLLLCIFKFTCQAGLKLIPAEPCFLDSLDKNPIPVLVIHCSGVGTAHKCPWAVTHPSGCEWQPEVPPWPLACSAPPPAAEGAGGGLQCPGRAGLSSCLWFRLNVPQPFCCQHTDGAAPISTYVQFDQWPKGAYYFFWPVEGE